VVHWLVRHRRISGLVNPDPDVNAHVSHHTDCLENQELPVDLGRKVADLSGCLMSGTPVEVERLSARLDHEHKLRACTENIKF
jgi:hypothetical protein